MLIIKNSAKLLKNYNKVLYRCPFLQTNHFLCELIRPSKITNDRRTKCSLFTKSKSIWEMIHKNKFKIINNKIISRNYLINFYSN